jgi:hypothetical protein
MKKNLKMYLGLIHFPVKNKAGDEVTTSVTNLDIHDIARSARTFGFKNYFIVTPIKTQQELVKKILSYWETDTGNIYNSDRQDALSFTRVVDSIEEAMAKIEEIEGERPLLVATGANFEKYHGNESELINKIGVDNKPMLLIFGTGWGLHASVLDKSDYLLEPIFGGAQDGYNHLSVRSAVAIYLDRINRSL